MIYEIELSESQYLFSIDFELIIYWDYITIDIKTSFPCDSAKFGQRATQRLNLQSTMSGQAYHMNEPEFGKTITQRPDKF